LSEVFDPDDEYNPDAKPSFLEDTKSSNNTRVPLDA
jgi:hypothetical protein